MAWYKILLIKNLTEQLYYPNHFKNRPPSFQIGFGLEWNFSGLYLGKYALPHLRKFQK